MDSTIEINAVLVKRLRNRDASAMDYLYDNYSEALFGIINRIVTNQEMAEDTLCEVFLKIWNQIDQYDKTKGTLFTWMYRIARNKAIDKTRSKDYKSSHKSNDINNYVDMFVDDSVDKTDYIGLKEAITALGEECKKLIQLNFFMGYSHAEISKKEDLPLGSLKTKIRKCLSNLKIGLSKDFG